MMRRFSLRLGCLVFVAAASAAAAAPIQIGFLWHMHQPNYYPYETVIEIDAAGHVSFSVVDEHNMRFGPYTTWPRDAIQAGLALDHLVAQVPASVNQDANVHAAEYLQVDLCAVRVDRATADVDLDCAVDRDDVAVIAGCLGGPLGDVGGNCPAEHGADFDGDGDVDLADCDIFQAAYP